MTCRCNSNQENEKLLKVKKVTRIFKEVKGALIPVLHEVQNIHGYLPEEALKIVSEDLNIPMTEIYGVATFYSLFSLEPKGEYVIRVCLGTACYVKGSQKLIDRLSNELDIELNKTTDDGRFTLEATRCIGACGLAPVMTIGDKIYGKLSPNDIPKILSEYKELEVVK